MNSGASKSPLEGPGRRKREARVTESVDKGVFPDSKMSNYTPFSFFRIFLEVPYTNRGMKSS
jgi:hypothetical protein